MKKDLACHQVYPRYGLEVIVSQIGTDMFEYAFGTDLRWEVPAQGSFSGKAYCEWAGLPQHRPHAFDVNRIAFDILHRAAVQLSGLNAFLLSQGESNKLVEITSSPATS